MYNTLYELTGEYMNIMDMLYSGEYKDDIIIDTLDGIEGEIEYKVENTAKVIKTIEGTIDMIAKEEERLVNRKKRLENSIKRMKNNIEQSMQVIGVTKIKTPLFSFTIQKNQPKLVIDNPNEVSELYLIPQPAKIDNAAIKAALLKKEEEITYAHLTQSESLRIR